MSPSTCPVCDAAVAVPQGSVVSEVMSCPDCGTRLVIQKIEGANAVLGEAPAVEEDWGQ